MHSFIRRRVITITILVLIGIINVSSEKNIKRATIPDFYGGAATYEMIDGNIYMVTMDESDTCVTKHITSGKSELVASSVSVDHSDEDDEDANSEPVLETYDAPAEASTMKSYTDYNLLNKESAQWNEIQCDSSAYTDSNGLRKVGEYYCVAMGSYYTNTLGDLFEIKTENGEFKVIICDFKADAHTDRNNQYTIASGCMVEFYVNTATLNHMAKIMGDISYADDNFSGKILEVTKLGNYFTAE